MHWLVYLTFIYGDVAWMSYKFCSRSVQTPKDLRSDSETSYGIRPLNTDPIKQTSLSVDNIGEPKVPFINWLIRWSYGRLIDRLIQSLGWFDILIDLLMGLIGWCFEALDHQCTEPEHCNTRANWEDKWRKFSRVGERRWASIPFRQEEDPAA